MRAPDNPHDNTALLLARHVDQQFKDLGAIQQDLASFVRSAGIEHALARWFAPSPAAKPAIPASHAGAYLAGKELQFGTVDLGAGRTSALTVTPRSSL